MSATLFIKESLCRSRNHNAYLTKYFTLWMNWLLCNLICIPFNSNSNWTQVKSNRFASIQIQINSNSIHSIWLQFNLIRCQLDWSCFETSPYVLEKSSILCWRKKSCSREHLTTVAPTWQKHTPNQFHGNSDARARPYVLDRAATPTRAAVHRQSACADPHAYHWRRRHRLY